jgi:hypothetical protein
MFAPATVWLVYCSSAARTVAVKAIGEVSVLAAIIAAPDWR